jgi:predicted component of type VI protein secretion system
MSTMMTTMSVLMTLLLTRCQQFAADSARRPATPLSLRRLKGELSQAKNQMMALELNIIFIEFTEKSRICKASFFALTVDPTESDASWGV